MLSSGQSRPKYSEILVGEEGRCRRVEPRDLGPDDRGPKAMSEATPSLAAERAAAAELVLRPAPPGLPEPTISPPVVAESGDPFAALRVVHLLARIERGRPVRVAALVDHLNATYLDWLFDARVVTDVLIQLQANWVADYRSLGGIVLDDGPTGVTVTIEASSRVDPWIVRQAERLAAECRARLVEFARRDRVGGEG